MLQRILSSLVIILLLSLLTACGAVELGLMLDRQGAYYFNDLPYGYRPSNGNWHRNYCWYEGYWYREGRGTPYHDDYRYGDSYFW